LIAISATTTLRMATLRQLITEIRELGPKIDPWILVGGQALGADAQLSKNVRADAWAGNIFDGVAIANRLVGMSKQKSASGG